MRALVPLLAITWFAVAQESRTDLPRPEHLTSLDPHRVELVWAREGWSLQFNDQPLKEFGRRQNEAQEALRVLRDLNLTERGVIGGSAPVLEYWLANGQAPTATPRGQRLVTFDLPSLRVEADGGQYCLRDAHRILFNFGYGKDEAEQALAVCRKYRFSRILLIGQAAPSMMVFLRDPAAGFTRQGHTLKPHVHVPPVETPTRPGEKKTEVAAIEKYVTPGIPALAHSTPARLALTETSPRAHAAASPRPTIPGVNDRILRVPFDWRQVTLRREVEGWILHAGSLVLARFGTDEALARKALLAVQSYRFTEWHLVGGENPCAHFFTVGDQVPRGETFGVPSATVLPEKLTIQKQDGRHALVQGSEVVLVLNDRPEEARQLLDWIQRHRIDRLARLMTPDGRGIMFFLKR